MSGRDEIRIVYFAWVRERIGRSEETLAVPAGVATVADLMRWLAARGPGYGEAFRKPEIIRAAIDRTHAHAGASIAGASEIAFFPPVTGG
jgi:molybdopterin synthase sulfur carrier subunit